MRRTNTLIMLDHLILEFKTSCQARLIYSHAVTNNVKLTTIKSLIIINGTNDQLTNVGKRKIW